MGYLNSMQMNMDMMNSMVMCCMFLYAENR